MWVVKETRIMMSLWQIVLMTTCSTLFHQIAATLRKQGPDGHERCNDQKDVSKRSVHGTRYNHSESINTVYHIYIIYSSVRVSLESLRSCSSSSPHGMPAATLLLLYFDNISLIAMKLICLALLTLYTREVFGYAAVFVAFYSTSCTDRPLQGW